MVIILFFIFYFCLNRPMDSCRALPQQQQLHGLHLFGNWQQRLQPELISERLRPAWAVQQVGFGEVHRRLPATRGSVESKPIACSVIILTLGLLTFGHALTLSRTAKKFYLLASLTARLKGWQSLSFGRSNTLVQSETSALLWLLANVSMLIC